MKVILPLYFILAAFLQAQDPSLDAKIKYNEGLALVSNGQNDCVQALKLFKEAIAIDSNNPKIHYMKGYCENRLNQILEALGSFKQSREIAFQQNKRDLLAEANRSIYHAHIRLAAFAAQDKDADTALRHLEASTPFATQEADALVHYYYALSYNLKQEYSKALQHAKEATKNFAFASGERVAPYFYELGYALEFTGQMNEAVRAYERAAYGSKRALAEQRIANIRELYVIY